MNADLICEWSNGDVVAIKAKRPSVVYRSAKEIAAAERRPAIVAVLPADAVVLKHLELPAVERSQLAAVVRLQAEGRLSAPLDQMEIDFAPLPATDPNRCDVLLAAVRMDIVDAQRRLAESVGGRLVSLRISALAAAECVARHERQLPARFVVVTRSLGRAELTCVDDGVVRQTQTVVIAEEAEVAMRLFAAVRRILLQRGSGVERPAFYLLGDGQDFGGLAESLRQEMGVSVTYLATAGSVGVVTGALYQLQRPRLPTIDFLRPRGREPARRSWRFWASVAACAAAVGIGVASWETHERELRQLDERAALLTRLDEQLRQRIEAAEPNVAAVEKVDGWLGRSTPWLEELRRLSERLPANDRVYLTNLQLASGSRDGALPTIKGSGLARERQEVIRLYERLLQASERYELQPHGMRTSDQDAEYPERFEIEANLRGHVEEQP